MQVVFLSFMLAIRRAASEERGGRALWEELPALLSWEEEKEEWEGSQDGFSAAFPVSIRDKEVPQTSVYLGRRNVVLLGGYCRET